MGTAELIERQGYSPVEFGLDEEFRAHYTAVANQIITLAQVDPMVHDAVTYTLLPHYKGRVNPTLFTVSGALNSNDHKISIHTGYQSRERANAVIPERNQPAELRALWDPLAQVLDETEVSVRGIMKTLGADMLADLIFHPDKAKRAVVVRTVKYLEALTGQEDAELVSGHADQSFATLHWYETQGGWFHAAPYPQELMTDDDTEAHRKAIACLREGLAPIVSNHNTEAAFFFGVGLVNLLVQYQGQVKGLPGCYHAGFKPSASAAIISNFARAISLTDRLSSITFMHPNTDILDSNKYRLATVPQCRPRYS